jgi:hypothetical protein
MTHTHARRGLARVKDVKLENNYANRKHISAYVYIVRAYDSLVAINPDNSLVDLEMYVPGIVLDIQYEPSTISPGGRYMIPRHHASTPPCPHASLDNM